MIAPEEDQRSGSLVVLALVCEVVANFKEATGKDEFNLSELVLLVLVLVVSFAGGDKN
ncbi:hypothetical protein [Micromonospora sp. MH99]|uniref:hypothetical protein n=1 Tax=Micromonospora sp. MH99 TaxID=1945510 RepID=UPI001F23C5D7|nr:hypothetical protein [Micromonospora sp. MH99]MCF0092092.1 hypothetical protein [Micromonospora sp. MH99]